MQLCEQHMDGQFIKQMHDRQFKIEQLVKNSDVVTKTLV